MPRIKVFPNKQGQGREVQVGHGGKGASLGLWPPIP
jgi:hypothetical protein